MANTYIYNMSDLWSNSLQQYAAIAMNVTDTASLANSHLLRLQVGSVNRFTVDKSGNISANSFYGSGTVFAPTISTNGSIVAGNSMGNAALFYDSANNSVAQFFGDVNNFVQVSFTNINTGNNASADIAIYDTNGLGSNNFVNLGITGSGYSNAAWTVTAASDGYLYTGNTSLGLGTAGSGANIIFFAGGQLAANERMRITNNAIRISNSSALVANGSNGASGAVLQSNGTGVYWSNATTLVSANIVSNTGLTIGTPTLAANGHSYLPNGLLANWGIVAANTTAGSITFSRAFTTACYVVHLTGAVAASNNMYNSAAPTTSGATIRSSSTAATGSNVYYLAIGV